MSYLQNNNDEFGPFHAVEDSIVSNPNTIDIIVSSEFS